MFSWLDLLIQILYKAGNGTFVGLTSYDILTETVTFGNDRVNGAIHA